jgi:hypothetical protein
MLHLCLPALLSFQSNLHQEQSVSVKSRQPPPCSPYEGQSVHLIHTQLDTVRLPPQSPLSRSA